MAVGYDYILGKLRKVDQGGPAGPPGPPGPAPTQANVLAALEYYDEDIANTPAILPSAAGNFAVAIGDGAVSSGSYSVVTGGLNNTASNTYAVVGGGLGNVASGIASVICGGQTNLVSAESSAICGGSSNVCTTPQSVICGGQTNSITVGVGRSFIGVGLNNETESADSFIGAGSNNEIEASSERSIIITGSDNFIGTGSEGSTILSGTSCEVDPSSPYCLVSGKDVLAHTAGMNVRATDSFTVTGDQQVSDVILKTATTDAILKELSANNSGLNTGIKIRADITMSFELHITARRTAGAATIGDSMYRVIRGCVKDVAGVLSFVGNIACDDQFEDAGAVAWVISLSASAAKLQIEVTGEIGETIHWLCQAKITEIG